MTRDSRMPSAAALVLAFSCLTGCAGASALKDDEEVVLFPTAAHLAQDGTHWVVPIHAWVFEPEPDSFKRALLLAALASSLGVEEDRIESDYFRERVGWFLVDNERGKEIDLTISPDARNLGPSEPNGHLYAELTLPRTGNGIGPAPFWLDYGVEPSTVDGRTFDGRVLFVPREGLSVISDIDDTVKVSNVTDTKALLKNTFQKPFAPAPGMVELYGDLSDKGAAFHFVSSSPWHLYRPLSDFFESVGLPNGSFHLRHFRIKDETFFNLFKSSRETKPPVIKSLLDRFPDRDFILIGDSGEKDPEIYGDIARDYPGQVRAILIRDVTAESKDDARYTDEAFKDLSRDLWFVFDDADEARNFLKRRL